ncbi:unnamed protein product [Prorocentrum cordatum]|uniref:Uncharacterized protein n=1 Tax=Prorocentrum cordatum TaxID=2364126 RepID=A0ABN9WKQ5_9DINO|nr:unnamed protein product [Polarella glacialis]
MIGNAWTLHGRSPEPLMLSSGASKLRTPLALHLHGDSSGEAESQGEPFSQLRAALASLSAHGTSAADWRAALRRAANSADNGLPESEEESSPDSASSRREVQRLSSMSQEDFIRETTVMLQKEVEMLSSSQRETLRAIQNGSVGKDQVEIVLAHYNEHVGWSAMYDSLITPYCKGAPEDYPWRPRYCKELPNKGREAHTFLHHIVQNYHMLADWTVFSQAQAPTSGMAEEGFRPRAIGTATSTQGPRSTTTSWAGGRSLAMAATAVGRGLCSTDSGSRSTT